MAELPSFLLATETPGTLIALIFALIATACVMQVKVRYAFLLDLSSFGGAKKLEKDTVIGGKS
ncbi:hypothetical protein [Faecalibaculum rodentium]|nr:hypothetical protein [Faecalibaculum rodentium]